MIANSNELRTKTYKIAQYLYNKFAFKIKNYHFA